MPHDSTIREWYARSDVNVSPGIDANVLKILKSKSDEAKKFGKEFISAVLFDEMNIRKHIEWSNSSKKMLGYSTYGSKNIASQAIVFMISDLNSSFRIPVAYHFIHGLKAPQRKDLLLELIIAISNVGVRIFSVTFDGYQANKKMCNLLGANLDVFDENFQTYFLGPDNKPIFIFFDPSHMIKLTRSRNTLARKKVLLGEQNQRIEWCYIEKLAYFYKEKQYNMTHKINQKHLQWKRQIMKVKIAVETLSASTASSI